MKRLLAVALAGAWHAGAAAADVLPAHLAGVWGTAESLYSGTVAQQELLLLPDGLGLFTGSTPPMMHNSGPDKGKLAPHMRIVMGLPLRATFEGDMLKAQPFVPAGSVRPGDNGPTPEQMAFTCRYAVQGQTLTCRVGPERVEMLMKRYLETVPAETEKMLRKLPAAGDGGRG